MTTTVRFAILTSISLGACTDADGPATTGAYNLDVTAVADTCAPPRPTGTFRVAVLSEPDALALDVPLDQNVGVALQRVQLEPPDRPAVYTRQLTECNAGVYERSFAVTTETPSRAEGTLVERWLALAGCLADAGLPPASCDSERQLGYTLTLACEAPCALVRDVDHLVCRC